ncbi:MAG: hypothetical protein R3F12_04975 [Lysobacteraceae bacterium]
MCLLSLRSALALVTCIPFGAVAATQVEVDPAPIHRVKGEASRPAPVALPAWQLAPELAAASKASRLTNPAPSSDEIQALHRRNADPGTKRIQIGLPRNLETDGQSSAFLIPHWVAVKGHGLVAHLQVGSVGAAALRVGLVVDDLDPSVELRFGGSEKTSPPVAMTTAGQAQHLLGDDGLYWTPNTDGDVQRIELFVPAGVAVPSALQLGRLSHLVVNSHTPYRPLQKIGESGACNVDVACRLNELGSHFADARNAVAHMRFVVGGTTYICTGTLLADTDPHTQVPLFHGANHCFSENTNNPPNSTQMQTVANTLNTFWNYEATTCDSNVSAPITQLTGGATYLYSNNQTDGMLIRLNNPAPGVAFFAGWNANPVPDDTAVTAIHHPSGDARMVSTGQKISQISFNHEVGWLIGTTEGGSSGSGLFTIAGSGAYELRGGLYGGFASCANEGDLNNVSNRDYYSRLDLDFAAMSEWLTPAGSQPPEVFANGFEATIN